MTKYDIISGREYRIEDYQDNEVSVVQLPKEEGTYDPTCKHWRCRDNMVEKIATLADKFPYLIAINGYDGLADTIYPANTLDQAHEIASKLDDNDVCFIETSKMSFENTPFMPVII